MADEFLTTEQARGLLGLEADTFAFLTDSGPFQPSAAGRMHLRTAFGLRLAALDLGFLRASDAVPAALTASVDAKSEGEPRLLAIFYRGHEAACCWLAAGVDPATLRMPVIVVPADKMFREFSEAAAAALAPPSFKMH